MRGGRKPLMSLFLCCEQRAIFITWTNIHSLFLTTMRSILHNPRKNNNILLHCIIMCCVGETEIKIQAQKCRNGEKNHIYRPWAVEEMDTKNPASDTVFFSSFRSHLLQKLSNCVMSHSLMACLCRLYLHIERGRWRWRWRIWAV